MILIVLAGQAWALAVNAARPLLTDEDRRTERVMLELRLVTGLDRDVLDEAGRAAVPDLVGGSGEPHPDGLQRGLTYLAF